MKWLAFVLVATCCLLVSVAGLAVDPPVLQGPTDFACYPTGIRPSAITSFDDDGDGWMDLAVSCYGSSNVWTYMNLGAGVFAPISPAAEVPTGPIGVCGGQMAPQWGQQAAVLSQFARTLSVVDNNTRQGFLNPALVVPVALASGNLDSDALLDLAVIDASTGLLSWYSSTVGVWSNTPGTLATPVDVAIGDLNNDGWGDVVLAGDDIPNGRILVFMSTGVVGYPAVGFSAPLAINLTGFGPDAVGIADFNGDGFNDLVVVGNDAMNEGWAQVFLNTVNPVGFTPMPAKKTWGLQASDVVAANLDGFGLPDFAVTNYGSQTVTIFLTKATGTTAASFKVREGLCLDQHNVAQITYGAVFKYALDCGFYPVALTAGDYDLNGKADLAIAFEAASSTIDPEISSCIEVIFDIACGFQGLDNFPQRPHNEVVAEWLNYLERLPTESTECPNYTECDEQNGVDSGNP